MKCCRVTVTGSAVPGYRYEEECTAGLYETVNEVDKSLCKDEAPKPEINEKFGCQVKAFELPQDFDSDIKIIGGIKDFATAWFGAFGEPKYLVYYETFPTGIEGVWTYDEPLRTGFFRHQRRGRRRG